MTEITTGAGTARGSRARYGDRLAAAVATHGPLCVGIDPHPPLLEQWGLPVDASGAERCGRAMVEASAGRVALVKPQSAFFEAFGSAGVRALERVLDDARQAGLLSLLDVKRGDIGSTMGAYARAYLSDGSPLAADAVTLSPYLGVGSLAGAFDLAAEHGRGVFVLAATSNPEAGELQRAAVRSGGPAVAQSVVDAVVALNAAELARSGSNGPDRTGPEAWGSIGLVVGATLPAATTAVLDLDAVNGPLLAPGVGAQGAGRDDLGRVFGPALRFVLPTSSRAIMQAGPEVTRLVAAIDRTRSDLAI